MGREKFQSYLAPVLVDELTGSAEEHGCSVADVLTEILAEHFEIDADGL